MPVETQEAELRLLVVGNHVAGGIEPEHAERDVNRLAADGDGADRPGRAMRRRQRAEIQIGQDVAVHDQEVFVADIGEDAQRPGRAQRLGLDRVLDANAVAAAIAEVGFDEPGEMSHGEGQPIEAGALQLADDDLENRPIPEWHQRFREHSRVGQQPPTLPAGEDHRTHTRDSSLRRARPGGMAAQERDHPLQPGVEVDVRAPAGQPMHEGRIAQQAPDLALLRPLALLHAHDRHRPSDEADDPLCQRADADLVAAAEIDAASERPIRSRELEESRHRVRDVGEVPGRRE